MIRDLAGKIAVVTGGASGIGLALARRAAAARMRVVLADIEDAALAAAADELARGGTDVLAVKTDVRLAESVDALAERVRERFGTAHLVFNNAGVGGVRCNAWEASVKDWEWVLGVNVWGVIHGLRAFTPMMLAHGEEAHIVNTASAAGFVAMAHTAPYAVSKHSVVVLSEVLRHDLQAQKANVGVSVLCPAFVPTNIWNADRNRPAALVERRETDADRADKEAIKAILDKGKVTAEQVAALAFDAVRDDRFYVFPHPRILDTVRTRMDDILGQRNPTRTA
ncbi:MAG: SDR family NAD(P)-dependent oxidoreductase [Burkholderiales bacterium]|jgi:NAD(P)-dependent dehydrogenase (short-subunit alcohol dehydrogenase family)|nr:SDR family NAD(P)-dependent oxidoreductase [Burkholderiales bacterium]